MTVEDYADMKTMNFYLWAALSVSSVELGAIFKHLTNDHHKSLETLDKPSHCLVSILWAIKFCFLPVAVNI